MPRVSDARAELHILVPEGFVVTRASLLKRGVKAHSLDNLLKSKQIIALQPGVYRRPYAGPLSWQTVVCSLNHMGSDLVVGGMTALENQGLAHYLSLANDRPIHLYGCDPMPSWLNQLGLPETFVHHRLTRLAKHERENQQFVATAYAGAEPGYLLSQPERAILEALEEVPAGLSFDHADQIMQGLVGLSPRRLDELLRLTPSVKVKRLFFWLAERQGHAWLRKLNAKDYDLGSGKRVLAKGGKLDKTYQITVPEQMYG